MRFLVTVVLGLSSSIWLWNICHVLHAGSVCAYSCLPHSKHEQRHTRSMLSNSRILLSIRAYCKMCTCNVALLSMYSLQNPRQLGNKSQAGYSVAQLACCTAGPSSNLGLASQRGFSLWAKCNEEMERYLGEWRRMVVLQSAIHLKFSPKHPLQICISCENVSLIGFKEGGGTV